MSASTWKPFGIGDAEYPEASNHNGQRVLNLSWRAKPERDHREAQPGSRLIGWALGLLFILGLGLLAVSYAAQFRYVMTERHQEVASAIEAGALDVGLCVLSLLALGLARKGLPATVERTLIVIVALSSALMNVAASPSASPRAVLAFAMPPVFLAVVVDRTVTTIRRHVLGMQEGPSPWAVAGRIGLYALRFTLAAPSTAKGLRRHVLNLTPMPDTARAEVAAPVVAALPAGPASPGSAAIQRPEMKPQAKIRATAGRAESKTARLIAAYEALDGTDPRYGDRSKTSQLAKELGEKTGMQWGSARGALYRHVNGKAGDR